MLHLVMVCQTNKTFHYPNITISNLQKQNLSPIILCTLKFLTYMQFYKLLHAKLVKIKMENQKKYSTVISEIYNVKVKQNRQVYSWLFGVGEVPPQKKIYKIFKMRGGDILQMGWKLVVINISKGFWILTTIVHALNK